MSLSGAQSNSAGAHKKRRELLLCVFMSLSLILLHLSNVFWFGVVCTFSLKFSLGQRQHTLTLITTQLHVSQVSRRSIPYFTTGLAQMQFLLAFYHNKIILFLREEKVIRHKDENELSVSECGIGKCDKKQ